MTAFDFQNVRDAIAARRDLDPAVDRQFSEALFAMSYDNPSHRPVLEAEGLRRWVAPHLDAYGSLR